MAPASAGGEIGRSGHGDTDRRGRSRINTPESSGGTAARGRPEEDPGLVAAMQRLLDLGGVPDAPRRYARAGGALVHYLDLGAGPALVLLQGAGGGCANWFRLLAQLSRRFRVLVPDLPGFGLSSPLQPRAPLGRQGADLVRTWLDAVSVEQASMMATSFGGLIALRFAQTWPQRIERLVLMDVVGLGRHLPLPVRIAATRWLAPLGARSSRRGSRWLFRRLLTTDRSDLPPAHQDALVEYLFRSARANDPRIMAASLRLFGGLPGQREVLADSELRELDTPLLLVWGERDRFLPRDHAERAARLAPHAELRIIPRAGHSPNWEAPGRVLDVVLPFLEHETGARAAGPRSVP